MGSVIALSRGTHDATVRLARSHVLWGACAADTTLSTTELSETDAVVLMRGTSGEIRNLTIADSPRPGVLVSGMGAEATLEGVVASSLQIAALVVAADARLVLRTVVARDTRSRGDFSLGRGLNCELAATLDARRVVVERNRDFGVYAALADTTLVLSDAVIRDTDGRATDDRTGRGLGVELGAIADVDRTLLERNRDVAIFASESDTRLMLDHVVVRDTQPRRGDGGAGQALAVQRGATGTLRRGLFERSFDVGVVVTEPGAALTASDLVVRDTAESMLDGAGGRSFDAQGAAVVDVSRALFERAVEVNVLVMEPDTASSLTDVAILDTESRADGIGGRGLGVQFGATVDANRLVVRDSRELGLSMSSPGSALAATNVVVRGVRVNGCADTTCPDQSYGFGVAVNREASFQLSDFIVADADVCGLHLALQGEGDLERGEVSGHPIGVCLQVDPYDSSRLTTGVRYLDNETNLQATSLPVPEPLVMVP